MYCNFFEFSEKPFDVTPDPRFLYLNQGYQEILASLIYGVKERRGFITIIGEVGTGKTTLLNALIDRIPQDIQVAFVYNTDLTFRQILLMVLRDLGQIDSTKSITQAEAVWILNDYAIKQFSKGSTIVLIIDEAQNLNRRSLESLRLLSNLETRRSKLLQIILSGQPELDDKLSQPELRQLAQRISMKRYALPLNEEETYEYIKHRLNVIGYRGDPIFSSETLRLIWEFSGGIPRKINFICDNALLMAYALTKKKIEGSIIKEVIKDLVWSPYTGLPAPRGPMADNDSISATPEKIAKDGVVV